VRLAFVAAFLVLASAACNPFGRPGVLTAHWEYGADTTTATMPVTATWCVGPERLDLRATSGDTGLAVAVYAADSSALQGDYPVMTPGGQVTVRPSAGVALRWVGKVQVQGWWGDSGTVTLVDGEVRGLSGRGRLWLSSALGPESVAALTFAFRGVRFRNDTTCDVPVLPVGVPIDSAAPPVQPGVH
jgi:hypothetical protein